MASFFVYILHNNEEKKFYYIDTSGVGRRQSDRSGLGQARTRVAAVAAGSLHFEHSRKFETGSGQRNCRRHEAGNDEAISSDSRQSEN